MKWRRDERDQKRVRSDAKLIAEARRLQERLTVTAKRLEFFSSQLQTEVDRLQRIADTSPSNPKER